LCIKEDVYVGSYVFGLEIYEPVTKAEASEKKGQENGIFDELSS